MGAGDPNSYNKTV